MNTYTDKQLLDKVKSLPTFKSIPPNYWILGVRSREDAPDQFDDKFYLYFGEKFIMMTTGTTNPGVPLLMGGYKAYNNVGAAVLKSDMWYYYMWKFGYHNGKVKALRQYSPCSVFRDGDMDNKSEEIGVSITGMYGINFHCATYKLAGLIRTKIGAWSAGCQVINDDKKYDEIIEKVKAQDIVSYCLLKEF